MLKSLRNLSDEEVVVFWSENPYAQDFCVGRELQWGRLPRQRRLDRLQLRQRGLKTSRKGTKTLMKAETGCRSEICPRIKVSLTRRPVV